jgi:aspartate-semialdehyde dehydrogenase
MKTKAPLRCALVGTDTLRGKELKGVLEEKRFPAQVMEFYDTDVEEEFSKLTEFRGEPKVIHPLDKSLLDGLDIVFLAADPKLNRELGRLAREGRFKAVDVAESFGGDASVPVVVVGVNDERTRRLNPRLAANPHPVTVILCHVFDALRGPYGLAKALAFVLEPASAYGDAGISELARQSIAMLSGAVPDEKSLFAERIAFNLLCRTEKSLPGGFSAVERRIVAEVGRVLDAPAFPLSVSLVLAPVFHTYAVMIYLELEKEASAADLVGALKKRPVFAFEEPDAVCSVSAASVAGTEGISIGSVKREEAFPRAFWLWAVADNLTRGSALNALGIAGLLAAPPEPVS